MRPVAIGDEGVQRSGLEQGATKGIFRLRTDPAAEAVVLMASIRGGMLAARMYGDPNVFATIVQHGMRQSLAPNHQH